jgi:hypothetical protein
VGGQEREAEGEVGAREDGERLDEDVGDRLVAGEVRVELVAVASVNTGRARCWCQEDERRQRSDRANNSTSAGGGIQAPSLG